MIREETSVIQVERSEEIRKSTWAEKMKVMRLEGGRREEAREAGGRKRSEGRSKRMSKRKTVVGTLRADLG